MQNPYEVDRILLQQLQLEQTSFRTHWKDLSTYINPRRSRFTVTDVNKGDRRNLQIIDNTATLASRTLRSGMHSGLTSPAQPWMQYQASDPDLNKYIPVKRWLAQVSKVVLNVFAQSNLYNSLPVVYDHEGTFGTAAMAVLEDDVDVMRTYAFPIGTYYLANGPRMTVEVFAREYRLTVRNIVARYVYDHQTQKFDWSKCSNTVKQLWDRNMHESWVDIFHVVAPNPNFKNGSDNSKEFKYYSRYYETGCSDRSLVLRDGGFKYFPILAPRWDADAEDVYGTNCPGMAALGDTKSLQLMHRRKAEFLEKQVRPPMQGPTSLKRTGASILPGDMNYIDTREGQHGIRPVHEVRGDLQGLMLDIADHQNRIKRAYYEDMFLALSMSDRREITAREVDERHAEKLVVLGPTLERQNDELLDPLGDIGFNMAAERQLIPPPPPEIEGQKLRVQYISIMAQAQKSVGLASMERFAVFATNAAGADPRARHKVNPMRMVGEYAEMVGVSPEVVESDEDAIKAATAEQQAAAMASQAEAAKNASAAASNVAKANLNQAQAEAV